MDESSITGAGACWLAPGKGMDATGCRDGIDRCTVAAVHRQDASAGKRPILKKLKNIFWGWATFRETRICRVEIVPSQNAVFGGYQIRMHLRDGGLTKGVAGDVPKNKALKYLRWWPSYGPVRLCLCWPVLVAALACSTL